MAADDDFDDDKLKSLLSNEIRSAITYDETELSQKRSRALEYYRGTMTDTPAATGRSSVVSKDVADTIGWMLPGIIRVFTASDHMAIYEPEKPGDEDFAKQATDYVNYVFMRDNPGYHIMWDSTHDSLLMGNGIVKHWWDTKEECEYSEHSGLTTEQIAILQSDQFVEVVAQKPGVPQVIYVPDQLGQLTEQTVQTFDVKVKRVVSSGRLRIECINPEDFLLDREATTIETARFCAHRDDRSRSDLIEMGFDKNLVESLPVDRFSSMQQEKISRDADTQAFFNMTGDESMMLVELFECYVKADVNGDGIAETVRAFYAGNAGSGELLDWEVWDDDVPFSDIPCEPIPHRWDARSVTDDTNDIQRVKTVLTRQFLDNLYWVNNPMTWAEENSVANPEMLRSPKFGGTIWVKKGATTPPTPLAIPFIGDKALLGLQHFDNVREMRTGVSRSTMALDPEALQNQTATANQNQKDAAYSQIELIARNQAELGWRRVFTQLLKLIVKHQDRPRTIRLRDTWVEMDPRSWNAKMDVTINIGLGTGSRDRDMAMLNTILTGQTAVADRLAGAGFMDEALEMLPKINMTLTKLAESAGIKNPDQFYLDIKPETLLKMKQEVSQRVDPKMQIEQLKSQTAMQIQASEHQSNAIKAQAEIQKAQAEAQIKIIEAQAAAREAQMAQQLAAAEIQVDQMKAAAQNNTVLTKAAIDNLVRLEVARIMASKDTDTKPDAAEAKLSQDAGV